MTPRAYSGFLDPSEKEKDAMSQFFVNEQCYTHSFLLQIEGKTKFQANSTTPRLYYLFFFVPSFRKCEYKQLMLYLRTKKELIAH